jgi:kumamolisin
MRERGRARRIIGALVVAVFAVGALAVVPAGGVDATEAPVPVPCPSPTDRGLLPAQAGARYGLQSLWNAGHRGHGVIVGVVEIGTAVDPQVLAAYQQCLGQTPTPFHSQVVPAQNPPPPPPAPSNESMGDAEMIVGLAPEIDGLYEFYGNSSLPPILAAALDPANYGGRYPDLVSISFNSCEDGFSEQDRAEMESALATATAHGVWIVKGAADSGSSACAPNGTEPHSDVCQAASSPPKDLVLAVDYPASSKYVIATGGIMIPTGDNPVTTVGQSWSVQCGGTGGGVSANYAAPPWQANALGRSPNPMRTVPDIASIAGAPGYELFGYSGTPATWAWQPIEGDSMTGPLHAAAFAAVRSALLARGITPPNHSELMRILYDPANYDRLFTDITIGTNKVFNDTCCDAAPNYDLNTGLGQLDFTELAAVLAEQARRPVPVVVPPAFTG